MMKRKKYSNDNRLTIQLSEKQYQKVLDLSNQIHCSKVDVIRYMLTGSHGLTYVELNRAVQYDEKLTDVLNKIYMNLYRIGGNLNQAVHNENLAIQHGSLAGLDKIINLDTLYNVVSAAKKIVYKDLVKSRKI